MGSNWILKLFEIIILQEVDIWSVKILEGNN